MNGSEEGQQPDQESTTKIDPEILSSLGLTQEDVEKLNRERLEEKRILSEMRTEGMRERGQFQQPLPQEMGLLITLEVIPGQKPLSVTTPRPDKVPDMIMDQYKESFPVGTEPKVEKRIKAFLEGFGNQSLAAKDWLTSINAFDIATDGGIMQNKEVLDRFKDFAIEDTTVGVEIAQAIQERINRRNGGSAQPEHRPAPPDPSGGPQ